MRASLNRYKTQILPAPTMQHIETIAVYAAMALIAAVVFGTLSVHPF